MSAPNRQGLKPFSFQTLYGTVETVPHKDFLVATQALKPAPHLRVGPITSNHLSRSSGATRGDIRATPVLRRWVQSYSSRVLWLSPPWGHPFLRPVPVTP